MFVYAQDVCKMPRIGGMRVIILSINFVGSICTLKCQNTYAFVLKIAAKLARNFLTSEKKLSPINIKLAQITQVYKLYITICRILKIKT